MIYFLRFLPAVVVVALLVWLDARERKADAEAEVEIDPDPVDKPPVPPPFPIKKSETEKPETKEKPAPKEKPAGKSKPLKAKAKKPANKKSAKSAKADAPKISKAVEKALAGLSPKQMKAFIRMLNTGTVKDLQSIPGVGASMAGLIRKDRPYENPAELLEINGIGERRLIEFLDWVREQN